jgi:hypothetical protein
VGLAPSIAGFTALPDSEVLPGGTATVGGVRAGFLRIGIFDPHGSPPLCHQAVAALGIPVDQPCEDECRNRIITHAYRGLGGGDDRPARPAQGRRRAAAGGRPHRQWRRIGMGGSGRPDGHRASRSTRPAPASCAARIGPASGPAPPGDLRAAAEQGFGRRAPPAAGLGAEAEAAKAEAERPCPAGTTDCPRIVRRGFATGLLPNLPAGTFADKPWSYWVFNAAQHHFREGAWDGPVVVLTDQETWSAAEQFAALLQDNRAGADRGRAHRRLGLRPQLGRHADHAHQKRRDSLRADCIRFRADGSNEVRGIIPDLLIGWRANDGRAFRARLLEAALPEAARRAAALHRGR